MAKPARRDGTPAHKNRKNHNHSTNAQRNRNRRSGGANVEVSNVHAKDIYVSNARPARHQHVENKRRSSGKRGHSEAGEGIRLQKVLAQAGVASRRMAEKLIDEGRVEVDGKVITRQGVRVDPNNAVIRVDGSRVIVNEEMQYFVLNKPRGVQSTMHDDMGRPCVGDIIGEKITAGQRLFHVGRLDAATEGLLLLTNDGELANRLMHPSYEVTKTYMATVVGEVDGKVMRELEKGIELDDGIAKADMAQIIDIWQGRSIVRIELHEGRKHIVRRMLKAAGYPVERLVRTKIHTVQLGEQTPGALRALNRSELTSLYNAVGL
ncbi:MAG: pseudouridine synthase [Corynebacterium sp.]|uniref:pseudouridine synthase n=1 Tax=Corynebacterium sp. TaxID=1720 RepID=UPI0026DC3F5F|nr:pseudouridine synthase [Corynebacterium sp.]MDO5028991.1 pseudouridine synthase [Corynebacterium sp.]